MCLCFGCGPPYLGAEKPHACWRAFWVADLWFWSRICICLGQMKIVFGDRCGMVLHVAPHMPTPECLLILVMVERRHMCESVCKTAYVAGALECLSGHKSVRLKSVGPHMYKAECLITVLPLFEWAGRRFSIYLLRKVGRLWGSYWEGPRVVLRWFWRGSGVVLGGPKPSQQ